MSLQLPWNSWRHWIASLMRGGKGRGPPSTADIRPPPPPSFWTSLPPTKRPRRWRRPPARRWWSPEAWSIPSRERCPRPGSTLEFRRRRWTSVSGTPLCGLSICRASPVMGKKDTLHFLRQNTPFASRQVKRNEFWFERQIEFHSLGARFFDC